MKYQDIADLPEDDRIDLIGQHAMTTDEPVAFITDDEAGKHERYISKLLTKFAKLELVSSHPGPVAHTVSVVVRKKRKEV